jgi:hypothetical protein
MRLELRRTHEASSNFWRRVGYPFNAVDVSGNAHRAIRHLFAIVAPDIMSWIRNAGRNDGIWALFSGEGRDCRKTHTRARDEDVFYGLVLSQPKEA